MTTETLGHSSHQSMYEEILPTVKTCNGMLPFAIVFKHDEQNTDVPTCYKRTFYNNDGEESFRDYKIPEKSIDGEIAYYTDLFFVQKSNKPELTIKPEHTIAELPPLLSVDQDIMQLFIEAIELYNCRSSVFIDGETVNEYVARILDGRATSESFSKEMFKKYLTAAVTGGMAVSMMLSDTKIQLPTRAAHTVIRAEQKSMSTPIKTELVWEKPFSVPVKKLEVSELEATTIQPTTPVLRPTIQERISTVTTEAVQSRYKEIASNNIDSTPFSDAWALDLSADKKQHHAEQLALAVHKYQQFQTKELATEVLRRIDSGDITTPDNYADEVHTDLKDIADDGWGQTRNDKTKQVLNVEGNGRLMSLLLLAVDAGFKPRLTIIDHRNHGKTSDHWRLNALDLGLKGWDYKGFYDWVYQHNDLLGVQKLILHPDKQPANDNSLLNGRDHGYGNVTNQNHRDHIHVSVYASPDQTVECIKVCDTKVKKQKSTSSERSQAEAFDDARANSVAARMNITLADLFSPDEETWSKVSDSAHKNGFLSQNQKEVLPIFHLSVLEHQDALIWGAEVGGVPLNALAIVVELESDGKADARSYVGAVGLGQVMPEIHPSTIIQVMKLRGKDTSKLEPLLDKWNIAQARLSKLHRAKKISYIQVRKGLKNVIGDAFDAPLEDPYINAGVSAAILKGFNKKVDGNWHKTYGQYNGGGLFLSKPRFESQEYVLFGGQYMIMAEVAAQLKNSGLANTQIREAMHSTEFNARMHAFRKRGGQTINKMPLLKQALGRYANNDLQKGAEQLAEKYRQTPNRFDSDVHPVEQTPGLGFENNIRG